VNDTIDFSYISDLVSVGGPHTFEIGSAYQLWASGGELYGWDISFSQYDECIRLDLNAMEMIALITNDSQLYVKIEPEKLYPGDTATVVIKKQFADGTLEDYDSTQTFEVAKLEGCIWGNILAEDSLGAYFYGVHQPIKFVVDTSAAVIDSLASDTGVVKLGVGLIEPDQKELSRYPKSFDVTDCFTPPSITNLTPVYTEIDNPLKIISPTAEDTSWINPIPEMPSIVCEAKLNGANLWEGISFDWNYSIGYDYLRREPFSPDTLCRRVSRLNFSGTTLPDENFHTSWEVPFSRTSPNFSIKIISSKPFRPHHEDYGGDCNEITNNWEQGNDIFTGGVSNIDLFAINQEGRIIAHTKKAGNWIKGINPDIQSIYQYTNSKEVEAIIRSESMTEQFTSDNTKRSKKWPYNTNGFPIYGPPNGYGLMQLDNLDRISGQTEKELWNWKAHIDRGKDFYFNNKKPKALAHLSMHYANEDQKLQSAFQMYNGGNLYKWNKDNEAWEFNTNIKKNRKIRVIENGHIVTKYLQYGIYVWKIYKQITNN